jgi:hypothetical protein
MLAAALRECTGEPVFPAPVVRAIAGGICAILALRLQEGDGSALASELTEWTLAQLAPRSVEAPTRLAELLHGRMRSRATAGLAESAVAPGERERLLDSALRAAGQRRDEQLSAIEIADGAGIPIEGFFELFDDGPHCLRVAFAEARREIAEVAARAGGPAGEDPQAIRVALATLLGHFAVHPERAHALTGATLCRVEEPQRQSREFADLLGSVLPLGPDAPGYLRAATVGALTHTIRVHQTQGRVELLPAVTDQLAYVALASPLGAKRAIEELTGPV